MTTTPRDGRKWTEKERSYLLCRWGVDTPRQIAAALGRTPGGVIARAVRREGLGTPAQGLMSLAEASRRLGYCPPTVRRAAKRAGISLAATHPPSIHPNRGRDRSRSYGIDDDTFERLAAALEQGLGGQRWNTRIGEWGTGLKPPACRSCGRSDKRHVYRGLCHACVERHRASGTLDAFPTVRGVDRKAWRRASSGEGASPP